MSKQSDRITVTFWGDDQVKLANEFRRITKDKSISMNKKLIELIEEFNNKNK